MRSYNKVTLSDVAQKVGVSAITVSRALRTPDKVSPRVRDEIARAIDALGYVPNPAARALASNRTDVIGVIIPSLTNNVFADVVHGVYAGVEGTEFELQLANTRYSSLREESLLRVFLGQKPAGLIVTGIDQSSPGRAMLENAPCPVVQIMETDGKPVDMMIGFSHFAAARAATSHLIEQGYTRLAFVGARMDPRSQRRFAGFRARAQEAGVFDERRVVTTTVASSVSLGAQLFGELMTRAPDVDAVFCNNDDLALGVLFEAQRRRLAIPTELGICGFNDLEMVEAAEPPITSVRTFRADMGRRAVEMLVNAIDRDPAERSQETVDLGFEVKPRRSTARRAMGGRPTA